MECLLQASVTCSAAAHSMDIKFSSTDSKYTNVITYFISPSLTGSMPSSHININIFKLSKGLGLVDEEFNIPGKVDMLI
jgi:hypothetical protein